MGKVFDGFKIGFGIFLFFCILFGLVFATGWHTADEIFGGTFSIGIYSFEGSTINFTGATTVGLTSSEGIEIANFLICNSSNEGIVNYDADENESTLQYCNGVRWIVLSNSPKHPSSCKEILDGGSSIGDGVYTIDADGVGSLPSFNVYCDMTNQGGGWTLVGYHADSQARVEVDFVNTSSYGLMQAARWIAIRDGMTDGMMFIDENDVISYMSQTKMNSANCIKINETPNLIPSHSIWHDDVGCDRSGTDYSFVYLHEGGDGTALYQASPIKFDIWNYANYASAAYQNEMYYFVK